MLGASAVSASLSGAGEAGLSGGEQVKPLLQVHRTLPATSVQHGPDLWTGDWAATSRLSWPSLAPRPPHTSASHSASKIPRASQEEPACQARTRKAQLQHGPWVHRFGRRYEQGPHPRTWAPRADASSLPPAHLGFVPQAQFIFAKNCSQVWAEALNGFTQCSRGRGSQELPEEAKGEKDVEADHEPKPEAEKEPELGQEVEQASPYSMDDSDPRKFFMSAFLCSATRRCRSLER
ncbi:ciliary microtubule inner protein 2B isoform X3 [Muntiacus reevesi]|uniref:ciliary microtubule inner protein 2B isoform X3 n=1 Tax=Muntiacus reevesi TaxID=9886 RepID=UPI0033071C1D